MTNHTAVRDAPHAVRVKRTVAFTLVMGFILSNVEHCSYETILGQHAPTLEALREGILSSLNVFPSCLVLHTI